MKILHIASFLGNIGDNASHIGLRKILRLFFKDFQITQIEIRKFYKNYTHNDKCYFDYDFVQLANSYDLLIIGGGGFLDYWVEGSVTGTTIDLDPRLLKKLKVPFLITSIGCNPHQKIPDGNIEKFRIFIDELLSQPKVKIALRNDGSINSFKHEIGAHYLDQMEEILDNGYFFETDERDILQQESEYAAVNITSDQITMQSSSRGKIESSEYYSSLADALTYLVDEKKLNIVLVPHIHGDLSAIYQLLTKIDDFLVRKNIMIAPCVQYDRGAHQLFSIYRKSNIVIGMRYHANVCNMVLPKPIVGLVALDRVKYAYDYVGLNESYVSVEGNFSEALKDNISKALEKTTKGLEDHAENVMRLKHATIKKYNGILSGLGLIT